MPRYLLPKCDPGRPWPLCALAVAALGCAGPSPGAPGTPANVTAEARLRARWLEPSDWGSAEPGGQVLPDTDVLFLGGPGRASLHLAFRAIPARPPVVRASITLFMHSSYSGPASPTRIVVHESGPFRGGSLTGHHRPSAMGAPAGQALLERPRRRLSVDITALVRARQRAGGGSLFLLVRGLDDSRVTFWSPRGAVLRERPRLTLFFR